MIRYKLARLHYYNTTDQYLTTRVIRVLDNVVILRTKLEDKRDDFNVPTVIFPFICSNIPAAPPYGKHISQLMRYSRACHPYHEFLDKVLLLTRKLLNQAFLVVKWKSSLRTLYCHHYDLVNRRRKYVSQMITDMFHLS